MIDSYADFYPTMRPRVPPCSDELIAQALQFAVRQLCLDSESYVWESSPYDLEADEYVYTLDQTPVAVYDIVRIKHITIKTDSSADSAYSKGIPVDERSYRLARPNILEFVCPPVDDDYSNSMYVQLVLAPFEDYSTMDWYFVNRWMEAIRAKALAYLYGLPGRLWSNPVLEEAMEQRYRRLVASARRENETRGTSHQLKMAGGDGV